MNCEVGLHQNMENIVSVNVNYNHFIYNASQTHYLTFSIKPNPPTAFTAQESILIFILTLLSSFNIINGYKKNLFVTTGFCTLSISQKDEIVNLGRGDQLVSLQGIDFYQSNVTHVKLIPRRVS